MASQDERLIPLPHVDRALDRPAPESVPVAVRPGGYGAAATDPAHLREYLNIVLKRKWLILSLVVVVTSLVTLHMYRQPSIYEAAATIQIEPKRDSVLKTGKGDAGVVINYGNAKDPAYINTQLRLLENPTLARQVIKTLDLQNNPSFLGQSSTGLLASLRRIFSGDARLAAARPEESGEAVPVVTEADVKEAQLTEEELARLEPYEVTLAANISVEPIVGTNLVTLKYAHNNPELAQKIVNTLADTFILNNIQRETSGTANAAEKLAKTVAELQVTIRQLEERRVNFALANNLPAGATTAGGGSDIQMARLEQLSTQLLTAENDRKNAEAVYLAAAAEPDANSIPEVQENKRVQELRGSLDKLRQKRDELLTVYTAEWPEVKKIDAQIRLIEDSLKNAPREVVTGLKTRYEAARQREASLRTAYNRQKSETSSRNIAEIQLSTLKADLESAKQNYNVYKQRLNEIEQTSDEKPNNISVTNYSRVPNAPVGPARLRTIILAFLLALGAGVGLAFLLDFLDDTLKSTEDVDRYLHLPTLALIPAPTAARGLLRGRAPAPEPAGGATALALIEDVRSPVTEAYRHLRTSLLLSSAGQPPRTVLVTSSQPSEGKTTTAVNTAMMLAQTDADVLLLDCDLRRPRIHTHFGLPNAKGVTNYLSGELNVGDLVQEVPGVPNLKVITSGPVPPNAAELLGSDEMRKLLYVLSENFTHIIVDSPPAISFTDARILSTMVDGVMLVVHGGRSSRAVVRRAKQQLTDVGAHIFGIVLNNVKPESSDYYYYSAGYYSNYYSAGHEDEGVPEGAEPAGAADGNGRR
ncbi:MAG TPA: polysaccharide biosynthesis tyrosine autokinase [Pyrinomonadaceae bacterium]|nr:polysaccharide biosynthesis tyrosine autokinase [Pyrinomonadaceae bacterium]